MINKKISEHFTTSSTKWLFTVCIALIPFFFTLAKGLLIDEKFSIHDLGFHGDLFVVAIVMVAEPMWELVLFKNKNAYTQLLIVIILLFILISAYLFSTSIHNVENELEHLKSLEEMEKYIIDDHNRQWVLSGRLGSRSIYFIIVAVILAFLSLLHVNIIRNNNTHIEE